MADKEKEEQKEEQNEEQNEEQKEEQNEEQEQATEVKEGQSSGFTLYTWLILAGIVIAGATGGFALSQLLAGERQLQPSEIQTAQDNQQQSPEPKSFDDMVSDESKGGVISPSKETVSPRPIILSSGAMVVIHPSGE